MATVTDIPADGRAGEAARRWVRRWLAGAARWAAIALATLIGALALALVLGALPGRSAPPATADTVRVVVLSNGFHSDIALPATGDTLERLGLHASHYPVDRSLVSHWAVGWGSREAFTSLVAVSDLTLGLVARAVAFDETVMHVLPTGSLAGEGVWHVDLPRHEYDALVDDMAGWFASREPMAVTQGFGDRFYPARGRFTAWRNCNAWVGARLRAAGVPVGRWTPAAQSLAYGLDRISGGSHE